MQTKTSANRRLFSQYLLSVLAATALFLPGLAQAGLGSDTDTNTNTSGWEPFAGLGFDIHVQSFSSEFDSSEIPVLDLTDPADPICCVPFGDPYVPYVPDPNIPGDPAPPQESPTSTSDSATKSLTPPMIDLELGLYGPAFSVDSLSLRPFVHFVGQVPTKGARTIGATDTRNGHTSFSVNFRGIWFVGGGVKFLLPTESRTVSLSTSLDYFGVSVKHNVNTQFLQDVPRQRNRPRADPMEVFRGDASIGATYHGIAPSIAIEANVGSRGSLEVGLYSEFRALILLSDRSQTFAVSNSIGEGVGTYRTSSESVAYQVGAGIRISWLGLRK